MDGQGEPSLEDEVAETGAGRGRGEEAEGEEEEEEGEEEQQPQQQQSQGDLPQNINAATGAKFPDLLRSFNAQVKKLNEQAQHLISMFTQKQWAEFCSQRYGKKLPNNLKVPMPPAVFVVSVSPFGHAEVRRSGSWAKMPLVDKYANELLWALKFDIEAYARNPNRSDIGGDHDGAPTEFFSKEMNPASKSSRGKDGCPQVSDQLKIAVREMVKGLREQAGDPSYNFCPPEKRHACMPGHPGGCCEELRAALEWPEHLPCVSASAMSSQQQYEFLKHFADRFPDISFPEWSSKASR